MFPHNNIVNDVDQLDKSIISFNMLFSDQFTAIYGGTNRRGVCTHLLPYMVVLIVGESALICCHGGRIVQAVMAQ